ncbi:glycosyltransferase family 4 protein [Candidatus Micrarchaeota archaeon]|nr:glycosyltransferase family 4 protein [Candidatus Micrarchaeota archaeon]
MQVVFSIGNRVGGIGGICVVAYYEVEGIKRKGYLRQLISVPFPLNKLASIKPYEFSVVFDRYAASRIKKCDIFHGWGGMCVESIKKAKQQGAVIFWEGSSTHPLTRDEIMEEEYKKNGMELAIDKRLEDRLIEEISMVDYITTPSKFAMDSYIHYGFPKENLFLVPYGVDLKKFAPAPKPSKFTVLYSGQVCLRKGVQYLLEAWKELNLKDAELHIVGKVWSEMKPVIEQYQMPNVTVTGKVEDTLNYYQNASLFVFPTLEEGSALVTYEAMACGLPIITTENSGSVVRNQKDGFIVKPKDASQLCKSIQHFYDKRDRLITMGNNARKRAEEYPWERCGDGICKAYEKVI